MRTGAHGVSPPQDTITLLTRTVKDAALYAFGLHGARVHAAPLGRPLLAVCPPSQWDAVRREMPQAIEDLATAGQRAGAQVRRIRLSAEMESLIDLQGRLFAFEARQSLTDERRHHAAQFSPRLQGRLAGGEDIGAAECLAMRQSALAARHAMGR